MKEQSIAVQSGQINLEGLLAVPDTCATIHAATVCHPHPLYGGSMYNSVVEAVLQGLWRANFATLRFNFRGVGSSEGEYGGGEAERSDAQAAVRFLVSQPNIRLRQALLAGYSFGATVALRAAAGMPEIEGLLAIALPIPLIDVSFIAAEHQHTLTLIAGDSDPFCPLPELRLLHASLGPRARLEVVNGADHFFVGRENELAALIAQLYGERVE